MFFGFYSQTASNYKSHWQYVDLLTSIIDSPAPLLTGLVNSGREEWYFDLKRFINRCHAAIDSV